VTSIQMPQLGETIVEGTILKWLKREGDAVARDEPLFEISTDKVDTEVPSPVAGTVTKILVDEGATVPVGTELMEISEADAAASGDPAISGDAASSPASGAAPSSEAVTDPSTGAASSEGSSAAPPAAPTAPVAPAPAAAAPAAPAAPAAAAPVAPAAADAAVATVPDRGPRSQILSPLVRRLAKEHDLDLARIAGTGSGGRITKADVMAVISSGGQVAPATAGATAPVTAPGQPMPAPSAGIGEEIVPVSHIRRAIAEHMLASTQTSARAWTMVEVNVDHLVKLRERIKATFQDRYGVKITYLPMVVRATVDALLEYPDVNARLDGDNIVRHRFVNIGIAVSYDAGLIVPVIKGADGMNTIGVARAIADLAARARSHQLRPDEVQGATFTITNPGPYGSVASVPIINQPNVGILSFDAIVKRPVVIDDAIAIRSMVNISMSWDHRVIDGELATRFLARVKENLETWDFAEDLGV
jgi:2-oxoglutarate dehydrogenase E2 component (dihydrolipoamide succinyltransferase)